MLTRRELLDRLDVLLGGRVAEEIVFHDVSTGAQDDLQRATDLVRHMITRYGMSKSLGLATSPEPLRPTFLDVPFMGTREHSEETARLIDEEVRRLLDEAHERVRATLTERASQLESLATLLLEREVVNREELARIMAVRETVMA